MTEAEATERWCPFARVLHWDQITADPPRIFVGGAVNRVDIRDPNAGDDRRLCNCIGSRCMAWRWADSGRMGADDDGWCGLISRE